MEARTPMEEEVSPPRPSSWRISLSLAAAGLILMLAGYAVMSHTPASPLRQLRQMAEDDPEQRDLAERLRALENQRPLRLAGGVAFYTGLLLFLAAGVRMYRQAPERRTSPDEPEENPAN
jgi:hypothetical protein